MPPQIAFTGCIDTWQPVRFRQTALHDRKACWATYTGLPTNQCSANQFCTILITLHVCGKFNANEEKLKAMNCDKSAAVWQQEQQEPPAVCQPLLLSRLYDTGRCTLLSGRLVSVQCAAQASPAVQEGTLDYPWQQGTSDNLRHLHT